MRNKIRLAYLDSTTAKKLTLQRFFLLGFLCSVQIGSAAGADWSESTDPLSVQRQPLANATSKQNPPGFSWVRYPTAKNYVISLRGPDGYVRTFHTTRNWYLPAIRLPTGTYFWKVRPDISSVEWSTERQFQVEVGTKVFEVPSDDQLIGYIRARVHPRSLSSGNEDIAAWRNRIGGQKAAAVQTLEGQIRTYALTPLLTEYMVPLVPRGPSEKAWIDSITNIRHRTQAESRQIRAAALLWRVTGNHFYLDEATRRGDALAALDPLGSTSHIAQDQGNRAVAWALTVAYDYLEDDLTNDKKSIWLEAIRRRTAAMYQDLRSGDWRLENNPLDSHGSTNVGYIAAISAILVDRVPEAEEWFRNSFRFYVHYQSPWSDEDGGFGNGTAYAEYSTWFYVDTWDAIFATTAVNLYAKPWSKGMLRFLACFVPPGSPTHAFGDAAETKPSTTTLKAFANRIDGGLAVWYSRNLIGTEDALSTLTNSISLDNSGVETRQPKIESCIFESIGWVAMHSRLTDRSRTSIYFKSSRYGSYNHSHGDQNSFTLSRGGRPLLIDSGWYDYYGSPLWKGWYRQTRAHNAITYDGGQGQDVTGDAATLNAKGRVTAFSTTPAVDYVAGDATQAYGGALTSAVRHMWYLRGKDAVLIWDKVESAKPRIFEWNMHAAAPFTLEANGLITVENQEQSLCITQLLGDGTEFHRRQATATRPGAFEDHAAFVLREAKKSGEFLVLLDIGCKHPKVSIDMQTIDKKVVVEDMTLHLTKPLIPNAAIAR